MVDCDFQHFDFILKPPVFHCQEFQYLEKKCFIPFSTNFFGSIIIFDMALQTFSHLGSLNLATFPMQVLRLSSQLRDPKSQATGTTLEEAGVLRAPLRSCVCARVCLFVCVDCLRARLAPSARSGFNWMIGALLACAVSVVQTLSRSHRLQQAPPLSIKANPAVTCEMTTGR